MGMHGSDVVATRCPSCQASLEAVRSVRLMPVAGRWKEQGKEAWTVRCQNSHRGTGESLQNAITDLARKVGVEL